MKLHVYLNHCGKRQQVGLLSDDTSTIFFEYAPDIRLLIKITSGNFLITRRASVIRLLRQKDLFGILEVQEAHAVDLRSNAARVDNVS